MLLGTTMAKRDIRSAAEMALADKDYNALPPFQS